MRGHRVLIGASDRLIGLRKTEPGQEESCPGDHDYEKPRELHRRLSATTYVPGIYLPTE
jgi:hypothetical protein